jgi:hypothetical protein
MKINFLLLIAIVAIVTPPNLKAGGDPWVMNPEQGRWQIFYFPKDWIERYAKPKGIQTAYIELLPPHPEDLLNPPSPCAAQSRIAFVTIDKESRVKSKQLSCVESGCEDESLWGYHTVLEGLTATILKDGSVRITRVFRKGGFAKPEDEEDPKRVCPIMFEEKPRLKSAVFSPSELLGAKNGLGSCWGR